MKFLRTLTEKSKLGYGRYSDYTVRTVLDKTDQGKEYIQWMYYNLSMISFHEDVLNEIGIEPKDRIEKPGAMPGWFYNNHYSRKFKLADNQDSELYRSGWKKEISTKVRRGKDTAYNHGHR